MGQDSWIPLPGHVVRAAVQYADSEQTKTRFPVVVSSESFNAAHMELIVAFTTKTANIRVPRDYDVEVSQRHLGFHSTWLRVSTTIRCGRLWTIDKHKILDIVGSIPEDILSDVLHLVRGCFSGPHR